MNTTSSYPKNMSSYPKNMSSYPENMSSYPENINITSSYPKNIDKLVLETKIINSCKELENIPFIVYVLRSESDENLMYCGYTNNVQRRLRQHNGLIKGGGKYTSTNRPWNLACVIPTETKSEALKVEYWLKAKNYPNKSFQDNNCDVITKSDIPSNDPVKRRVFLIKKSMIRHNLTKIIFLDDELCDEYDKEHL